MPPLVATRTLRRGWPNPLAFPGFSTADGRAVPYPELDDDERMRLVAALTDYKTEVARVVDARISALAPDLLCVIRALVKS